MAKIELQPETLLAAGIGSAIAGVAHSFWWLLLPLLLLFLLRRYHLFLLAGVVLGTAVQLPRLWEKDSPQLYWPTHDQRMPLQFRLTDPRLSVRGVFEAPARLKAEALSPCRGEVTVLLPDGVEGPLFGEEICADGVLKRLESGAERRLFAADRILWRRPGPRSIFTFPLLLRDHLVAALLRGVREDSVRQLAPQLFFGAGCGPGAELRQTFLYSGTVHLFSVSGMHVGVLAGLLLLLLRPLSFRYRYWFAAAAVCVYVLATGANVPALRAGFMIAVWCLLRSSCRYTPPFRSLMLAASLLMLAEPGALLQIGFQYSFFITAVLLLMAERMRELRPAMEGILPLLPPRDPEGARKRLLRRIRMGHALLFSVAAFLAGAAISAARQDLLLPGSVFTNLLLLPLTPFLFLAMGFQLSFGWLFPGAGAFLLESAFGVLQSVAEFGCDCFGALPAVRPELWEVLLYLVLLTGALTLPFRRALLCGGAALALLISWPVRAAWQRPFAAVLVAGDQKLPGVVIGDPGRQEAVLVQAPDKASCLMMSEILRKRGMRVCELHLTERRSSASAGIGALAARLKISRLVLPAADRFSARQDRFLAACLPEIRIDDVSHTPSPLRIFAKKNDLQLDYWNPGSNLSFGLHIAPEDAGAAIRLLQGNREQRFRIPWGNTPEVWLYEF